MVVCEEDCVKANWVDGYCRHSEMCMRSLRV